MASSYRFVVSGQVQGVGFRYSAMAQARRLGLTGWVANLPDGSVEGVAAGPDEALRQFRDWLRRGPPAARVKGVAWDGAVAPVENGFEIRR
jgi:acylphosphatase